MSKAAAASSTAARAWAASCTRPSARSFASSKLCTPIDSRVTPASRKARKRSRSKVPGLASSVTSQPASSGSSARTSPSSRSICSGANRLGVPPPMKTLWMRRPHTKGSAASRSATSASTYWRCTSVCNVRPAADPGSPVRSGRPRGVATEGSLGVSSCELKSQYGHFFRHHGRCTYRASGGSAAKCSAPCRMQCSSVGRAAVVRGSTPVSSRRASARRRSRDG